MNLINDYLYNSLSSAQKFMAKHPMYDIRRPRLVCEDGFAFNVDAGQQFYSEPDGFSMKYITVQLSNVSESIDVLLEFGFPDGSYDFGTYKFVPVELVDSLIELHGGIKK